MGKELTSEQYAVLRGKATETPFKGKYLHETKEGVYKCMACGNPLFPSDTKFDSGTGWPSFDQALPGAVELVEDKSHGFTRTEVLCARCGSHLGHVFDDGPTDTGKRYCMNSICLDLEEKKP
ncbi:MAG: peptide-methionine (R)-S-oxide reductase MsrB [Candidatus Pacebacteria bacterium]|nr:peptide-methionine (R)-S-oxide reductase MsrB [Candidatus Paceibacterota bacterium]